MAAYVENIDEVTVMLDVSDIDFQTLVILKASIYGNQQWTA